MEIAAQVYKLWKPTSVFDAGCALGSFLDGFWQTGGCCIRGCEIGYHNAVPYMSEVTRRNVYEIDLTKPMHFLGEFDLVMSIEVAEHLPEEGARQYAENLTKQAKDRIWITAAGPGQPGSHHVNCQPPEYWSEIFSEFGWILDKDDTEAIKKTLENIGDKLSLAKNCIVFRKKPKFT